MAPAGSDGARVAAVEVDLTVRAVVAYTNAEVCSQEAKEGRT